MATMTTNIETLRTAGWDAVEKEVVMKLRLLRAMAEKLPSTPENDRIAKDLIIPALGLLGEFCQCVEIEPEQTN